VADLARFIDRDTIEFVRVYPHPIERVWRAISDPTEISAWFWTATFELRVGAPYRFGDAKSDMTGVITKIDPPRLLCFGGPAPHGPDGYMQFELDAVHGGTRMRFVQHSTPGYFRKPEWPADHPAGDGNPWRPGTLTGWHLSFDALGQMLSGEVAADTTLEERGLLPIYRAHMLATQP
jgi:uncharacterized protein YndB with AHSA1/START domain